MRRHDLDALTQVFAVTFDRTKDLKASVAAVLDAAEDKPTPDVYELVEVVSSARGVRSAKVWGRSEEREVVIARLACWWVLSLQGKSAAAIGRDFGRDKSPVSKGLKRFERLLAGSAELRAQVEWFSSERLRRSA